VPTFEVEGRSYEVDEDGFLQEPECWNHVVAKDFAATEAIADLTEEHWKVIHPQLLPGVWDCAHDSQAMQGNRAQTE
jgi:sulfur relay (sulfurtransferase) DsrC/TusE family protein